MNAMAAAILMSIAFASVHVKLTVANSCTIKTGVSLAAVLPDCRSQGVSAVLSVEKASASEDSYLATIDF
jgi:hypothetical protein